MRRPRPCGKSIGPLAELGVSNTTVADLKKDYLFFAGFDLFDLFEIICLFEQIKEQKPHEWALERAST
jgi:hypothetical protein